MHEESFSKIDTFEISSQSTLLEKIEKQISFLPEELIKLVAALPPEIACEIAHIPITQELRRASVGDLLADFVCLTSEEIDQLLPEEKRELLSLLVDRIVLDLEAYMRTCEDSNEVEEGIKTFLDIWWQNRTKPESEIVIFNQENQFSIDTEKMLALTLRYFSAKEFILELVYSLDIQESFAANGWKERNKVVWENRRLQYLYGKPIPERKGHLDAFQRGVLAWLDIFKEDPALLDLAPSSTNHKKDKLIEHAKNYIQSYKDAREACQKNEREVVDFASMEAEIRVVLQILSKKFSK